MKYSTMVRCLGERNNLENYFAFLDLLKKTDVAAVNLSFSEIQELLTEDFDQKGFTERFLSYGLAAHYAHGPMHYPFLFNRTDGKEWEEAMMTALELAAACGVTDFVMHPGSVLDEENYYLPDASYTRNLDYFMPYLRRGQELGVRIAMENGINQPWDDDPPVLKNVSPNFDELISLTDTLNEKFGKEVCGICFDFGHAHIAGLDIPEEIRRVGKRLRVTHVHDNSGLRDQHLPVGQGTIDWVGAAAALKNIGYDRELSLELYYGSPEFQRDPLGFIRSTLEGLYQI